jgi:hypothetical protein
MESDKDSLTDLIYHRASTHQDLRQKYSRKICHGSICKAWREVSSRNLAEHQGLDQSPGDLPPDFDASVNIGAFRKGSV